LRRPSVNLHAKLRRWLYTLALITQLACGKREPPGAVAESTAPLTLPAQNDASLRPRATEAADALDAGRTASSPSSDAGALPQTHDKPRVDTDAFNARVQTLFDGIVHDDPERAMPFFFPLAAYQQVKAIAKPERDWQRRLVAHYARDIHALAKDVGPAARFVRVEVPSSGRWVEPDEEYNRIGYYRVYGTRIIWTAADGKEKAIRISSMISWRGEWYVVHLSGFK